MNEQNIMNEQNGEQRITADEIDRARRLFPYRQILREHQIRPLPHELYLEDDHAMDALRYVVPRSPCKTTFLLAGTAHQATLWKRSHRLGDRYKYISRNSHIRGYRSEDVDLIRVGEWWLNPLTESQWFNWQFPNWRESPIEELPNESASGEFSPGRFDITINVSISEETRERVRQAFQQAEAAIGSIPADAMERIQEGVSRVAEAIGASVFTPQGGGAGGGGSLVVSPPLYGKQQEASIYKWCADNGYTDPFFQEGHWWAFPPQGVMPVQLRDVAGHSP